MIPSRILLSGAGFDPKHHVTDSPQWHIDTPWFSWHPNVEWLTSTNGFLTLDMSGFMKPVWDFFKVDNYLFSFSARTSITVVFMWISAALLVGLVMSAARNRRKNPLSAPHGLANMIEALVVFVRDEIVYPNLGHKWGARLLPYFLTIFFFIATMNYVGLVPFSFTPTSQFAVTFTLAAMTLVGVYALGFIEQGPKFIFTIVPMKLELNWMLPIMVLVWALLWILEFGVGVVIKSFALMVRLKANMTAGHLVILSVLFLPFQKESYAFGVMGVAMALLVMLIECLVCLIQAYVFTLLTAVFVGHSVHHEEEHH